MRRAAALALALTPAACAMALAVYSATAAHADTTHDLWVDQRTGDLYADVVDLTSIDDIDVLPQCHVEDCSDVPRQVGLWRDADTGNWYLSRGERSWLIVDDTVSSTWVDGCGWDWNLHDDAGCAD